MNTAERLSFVIFILLGQLIVSAKLHGKTDAEQVQEDTRTFIQAFYRGDFDTVLKFTHPNVIRMMGEKIRHVPLSRK